MVVLVGVVVVVVVVIIEVVVVAAEVVRFLLVWGRKAPLVVVVVRVVLVVVVVVVVQLTDGLTRRNVPRVTPGSGSSSNGGTSSGSSSIRKRREADALRGGVGQESTSRVNQSIKSTKRHTSTREATSQRNHTGSKPRDAKRCRLGGRRASRASVSLRDSLYVYTLFTEARKKLPRKTTSDVSSS